MLTRPSWSAAFSFVIVGSAAVVVQGSELPSPLASPETKSPVVEKPAVSDGSKAIKPKELGDPVKKGLAYLISQQHDNGGFGQGGGWRLKGEGQAGRTEGDEAKDQPDMGNTCVAALALIRAGNTPKEGTYSKQLLKALEFIETHVEAADKESMYVTPVRDTQLQSKIGRYVDTFLAALVMSELKGQMPDRKSEDRLFAALNKTIGKIESNQATDGTFAGNSGWASVLSQGICSKALSRASQKGVAVKAETIKRDLDQTVAQLTSSSAPATGGAVVAGSSSKGASKTRARAVADISPSGGAARSDAGVDLYFLAANGARVQESVNANQARKDKANSILKNASADERSKEAAESDLKEVAAAESSSKAANDQLVTKLSSDKFLQGFGNNGGEEFLSYMNISETLLVQGGETWEKWDRQVCDTITKVQNEDGSWSGHHCITGRTFCTAAALLTMMADRAPLPTVADAKPAK